MKIGILSSYKQECGIAEYAAKIRIGFEQNGHEVIILGNYPYKELVEVDDDKTFRCFHVEMQDQKNDWDLDGAVKFADGIDILLIQYEASLYPSSTFNQFLEQFRQRVSCKVVMVFHSSCQVWSLYTN